MIRIFVASQWGQQYHTSAQFCPNDFFCSSFAKKKSWVHIRFDYIVNKGISEKTERRNSWGSCLETDSIFILFRQIACPRHIISHIKKGSSLLRWSFSSENGSVRCQKRSIRYLYGTRVIHTVWICIYACVVSVSLFVSAIFFVLQFPAKLFSFALSLIPISIWHSNGYLLYHIFQQFFTDFLQFPRNVIFSFYLAKTLAGSLTVLFRNVQG